MRQNVPMTVEKRIFLRRLFILAGKRKEREMERKFSILNTTLQKKGKEYIKMFQDGKTVPNPVIIQDVKGKLTAFIDGDPIGFVKDIAKEDLPNFYEVKLAGLVNDKTFAAVLTADDAAETTNVDFAAEYDAIAKAGIVSKEEVDFIVNYLKESEVHPSVIKPTLQRLARAHEDRWVPKGDPLYQHVRAAGMESFMQAALKRAVTGRAIILVGEKSTGKGVFTTSLGYVSGLPVYVLTMQADMTIEDILGGKGTDNSASDRLAKDKSLAMSKIIVEFMPEKATEEDFRKAAEFELLAAQAASIHIIQNESRVYFFLHT